MKGGIKNVRTTSSETYTIIYYHPISSRNMQFSFVQLQSIRELVKL